MSDPEVLFAEISRLHRAIHRHDPLAVNERERQAAVVLTGLQGVILELVSQSVHLVTLETSLSYHWLRLATLTRDLDEALFDAWSGDLGGVMQSVGLELRAFAAELSDDSPARSRWRLRTNRRDRLSVPMRPSGPLPLQRFWPKRRFCC